MIGLIKILLGIGDAGIHPREAMNHIQAGALLVDVREPHEFSSGHAPQAHSLPLSRLQAQGDAAIESLRARDGSGEILLICQSGMRSRMAQRKLASIPTLHCVNVRGGMMAWRRAGLPISHGAGK